MIRKPLGCALAALSLLVPALSIEAHASADLSIVKSLTSPPDLAGAGANPGENVVFTITVTNHGDDVVNGDETATDVTVTDDDFFGLSFVSNSGDCTTPFPCSLGTMALGAVRTITSTWTVTAGDQPPSAAINFVEVTSSSLDENPENDFSTAYVPINGINCGNFQVSAGLSHTCAIVAGNGKAPPDTLDDDVLECWGDNGLDQTFPVPAGFFSQVSSGAIHTCALATDGSIECWGYDGENQVTDTPSSGVFTQLDVGYYHTCALRDDNAVTCWGDNSFGQLDVPADTLFVQVAANVIYSCGLTTESTIVCWGDDGVPGPDLIVTDTPPDADFVQVVAGGEHACGRHEDGTVECWGTDYSGETADPIGTFLTVSAGDEHNCGLRSDSTAECWGDDSSGQVSDVPGDAFTSIDAGPYHNCGLLSDGSILCWGDNSFRQATAPGRSDLCPTCGDGDLEGRETCEACFGLGTPECVPNGQFDVCCSPVTCTAYRLSENHVCRPGTGSCDAPEVCDGINFDACPAPGPLRPSTFVCRAALGSCDPEELCTGASDACPANGPLRPDTYVCRTAAGACDIAENCTGTDEACPADVVKVAATPCRIVAGTCDVAESCDGTDPQCPADTFVAAEVLCRAVDGFCDVAENCSGTAAACPADGFLPFGTECRPSIGVCDNAESCTGTGGACPEDALAPNTQVCRPQNGVCDVAETCTGGAVNCPANSLAPPGQVCRVQNGVCDQAETCTGVNPACPANTFRASTVVCRDAVDACDVDETCTGAAGSCPANAFASADTPCDDAAFCNGADSCDGTGGCDLHTGDPCPGPDGDGNCAESCDEGANNCLGSDADASECDDGSACTTGDSCSAGTCVAGAPEDCDDGILCTADSCDPEEGCQNVGAIQEAGCYEAGKFTFAVKDTGLAAKNSVKWGWKKGAAVDPLDLGTPLVETSYALCIFDQSSGVPELVGSYVVPPDGALWLQKDDQVRYSDKPGTAAGVTGLKVKSSTAGKSVAQLKAVGVNLDLPDAASGSAYFSLDPSLTVQLRNDAGACWTSEFTPDMASRNTGFQFKAVGP